VRAPEGAGAKTNRTERAADTSLIHVSPDVSPDVPASMMSTENAVDAERRILQALRRLSERGHGGDDVSTCERSLQQLDQVSCALAIRPSTTRARR